MSTFNGLFLFLFFQKNSSIFDKRKLNEKLFRRSILFGIFGVILSILLDIYIFILLAGISDSNIILFMDCVASHPQENPPPCQREYSNGYAFMMFHLFTSALPGSACLIFYWTNSSILIWWKEFIFSKRILTQKSNYEEVGERIDSLNQF